MNRNIDRNNDFQKTFNAFNLHIHESGYAHLDSEWNNGLRDSFTSNAFSRIYYVVSGKGTLIADNVEYTLLPGNVYFIPAYTAISYFCDDHLDKLYFDFSITDGVYNDILQLFKGIFSMTISIDEINDLIVAYIRGSFQDIFMFKNRIYGDLIKMLSDYPRFSTIPTKHSSTVLDATKYIVDHLSITLTVEEIATALHTTKYNLNIHFKNEIHKSIGEYIDDLVMEEAYRLITKTELKIKQISEKFNFCDQYYFSHKFKKYYSISPSQLRKISSVTYFNPILEEDVSDAKTVNDIRKSLTDK